MDHESPTRISGKSPTRVVSRVDESRDGIECSGRYCGSCTAAMVADCVAICCCPCAVVNLLTFAFVKVPWLVGRRFLRLGKKKKGKKRRKLCSIIEEYEDDSHLVLDRDGINAAKWRVKEEFIMSELFSSSSGFGEQEEHVDDFGSPRFEAEKVWLELYQVGHLGFGSHSISG